MMPPLAAEPWTAVDAGVAPAPSLCFLAAPAPPPAAIPHDAPVPAAAAAAAAPGGAALLSAPLAAGEQSESSASADPSVDRPPVRLEVRGAGSVAANGLYVLADRPHNSHPMWRKVGDADITIIYDDGGWWIGDFQAARRDFYQTALCDTALPPLGPEAWAPATPDHDHTATVGASPTLVVVSDTQSPLCVAAAAVAAGAASTAACVTTAVGEAGRAARAAAGAAVAAAPPSVQVALADADAAVQRAGCTVRSVAERDILPVLAEGGSAARQATESGLGHVQSFTDRVVIPAVSDSAAAGRDLANRGAEALTPMTTRAVEAANGAAIAMVEAASYAVERGGEFVSAHTAARTAAAAPTLD
jgi:hypothetical protein